MAKPKKMRNLMANLKDKISIFILTKRASSSILVAVIRATIHHPISPPPESRIAAILALGSGSRTTASTCIKSIMDRLHRTRNAYVALKCLIAIHVIIQRGSFILKDQLSFYPTTVGRNSLNLTGFRDESDADTWELSSWVRWYAGVLEHNLMVSRVLGSYLSYSTRINMDKVSGLLNPGLFKELNGLSGLVEEICRVPDSLYVQKNDLVYEVMRLVGEDYKVVQSEILIRLSEFNDRLGGLSFSESVELLCGLNRLEECKERLRELFLNKKKNNEMWDLVSEMKKKLVLIKKKKEDDKLVLRINW